MEFLVTMTTVVPPAVGEPEVAQVRAREAVHSAQLARDGRLLRLWRPPLQPGEWRTLGLFDAGTPAELETVLAGMPLRIWRTDEVTVLDRHPNDPGREQVPLDPAAIEFLTFFALTVPAGTDPEQVAQVVEGEAKRTSELAGEGRLLRLWALPGEGRALGHWQAADEPGLREALRSLPMDPWLEVRTVPLTRHPSDPATSQED